MPDMRNQQTLPTMTYGTEKDRAPIAPASSRVERRHYLSDSATITTEGPEAMMRDSSDSFRATSPVPSPPRSPAVSTPQPPAELLDQDSDQLESHTDHQQISLPSALQTKPTSPDHPSRYLQAFSLITSLVGTTLSPAKLIIVIRTGDRLIRDDAVPFLKEQLPLWKGMWYKSNLLMPSSDESTTDHFVKVSRCIAIMGERSTMDRIRILLHKVLQYQFYVRSLKEVKAQGQGLKSKEETRHARCCICFEPPPRESLCS